MVDRLALTAAVETDLIGDLRKVLPVLGHVRAGLSGPAKLEGALDVVPRPAFHCGLFFAAPLKLIEVQFLELRFWIEGVEMRWSSFHHEEDYGLRFCLGREMSCLRGQRRSGRTRLICTKQSRQRTRAEARTKTEQRFTAGDGWRDLHALWLSSRMDCSTICNGHAGRRATDLGLRHRQKFV